MSMAAKLSDLVDKMPGANLQGDGQVEVPTQGAKDLWGKRKQIVPLPTHHHGPVPGGHHQATPMQHIV